jgi:hypothetical protein
LRAARPSGQPVGLRPVMAPGVCLCTIRFTTRRGNPIQGTRKRRKNHHAGLTPIQGRIQPPETCRAYSATAIAKAKKTTTLTQLMRKLKLPTHAGYRPRHSFPRLFRPVEPPYLRHDRAW